MTSLFNLNGKVAIVTGAASGIGRAAAIRFVSCDESASAYDDIGATAAEGVRNTVYSLESAELTKIWERVNNDEKRSNKE